MRSAERRALRTALAAALAFLAGARPGAANPVTGAWSEILDWPIVGIHMVQLHTGEILVWSSQSQEPHLLDPADDCFDISGGCFTEKPNPVNIFCGGQTHLDDGTIIVNGGHVRNNVGEPDTFLFQHDLETGDWNWTPVGEVPDTDFARWYPTLTTLPDGRVLNVSGSEKRCVDGPDEGELCMDHEDCAPADEENCTAQLIATPELFDPATRTWQQLPLIDQSVQYYPFNFVDPGGTVFFAGADVGAPGADIPPTQSHVFDVVVENETLTPTGAVSAHDGGSAVMYEPGRILKTGGASPDAIAAAEVIDLNGAGAWALTGPMNVPRRRHNLTVLPDGTVLATGGTRRRNLEFEVDSTCGGTDEGAVCGGSDDCPEGVACEKHTMGAQQWVAEAEIWDPSTGDWTSMASSQVPRMYHSTALLLPDGRVLSAGGGRGGGAVSDYANAEIFSPPYRFTGTPPPVIADAPEIIHYGEAFEVLSPEAAGVGRVSLIRLAAVTHSFDQNRRFVPLTFNLAGDGRLEIDSPPGPNVAPPGYYMLFLVSEEGVPSVARFVRLLPADPGAGALYEYSAKVVCGTQGPAGEPHAPGLYTTSVNIHNPGAPVRFFKKLALTFPPGDQRAGEVLPLGEDVLGYDAALQTDCRELRRRLVPTSEAPFIEGFLVVQSRGSLDVAAVYATAAVDEAGAPTGHSSIDVEEVRGRARGGDLRTEKSAVVFPPILSIGDRFDVVPVLYTIEIENLGPEAALGLRADDQVTLEAIGAVGALWVLQNPIDLPPGGAMVDLAPSGDGTSVSFALELGDLAAGDSLEARFWVLVALYRLTGDGSALVRNVVTAGAEGPELTPLNNTAEVESEIP